MIAGVGTQLLRALHWRQYTLTTELETAIAAAHAAGEVVRRGFGQAQRVRYKGPVDLVTEYDEESERIITGMLRDTFPTYGFLAEEGGITTGDDDARWIIDPIDGTTNFAHGFPFFAISIALQKAGELVLGVVYNPVLEELFVAERGAGATLNGERIHTSATTELMRALLVSGFPYDHADLPAALELWNRFATLSQGQRRTGAAALDCCYVACGRFDAYYEEFVSPWDIAAGALIIAEAGGTVTDLQGSSLDLGVRGIVASNGALQPALIEVTAGQTE